MNKFFIILLVFFYAHFITAQKINEPKKAKITSNKIKKSVKNVIEVPFELVNNLIVVDVMLNGTKRKFIVDSGAPIVVLNSKYFKKDSNSKDLSLKGVNGNISGVFYKKIKSLDFNGIQLNDQEVYTMNLAHLEAKLQTEFHGLIGYNFIKDYDILFDYKKKILTLINSDTFDAYKNNNLSNSRLDIIPFELETHIPIIEAKINDKILKFGIDSGAAANLIDDDFFPTLKKQLRKIKTVGLHGAGKGRKEVKKGKLKKMTIGNTKFRRTTTSFSDISHLNKGYKVNIDGLIGYPILSKQKTLISFRRKELVFIK